jgi:7-cyano-7-deazaguanine synthase in queuosine biosynthesis
MTQFELLPSGSTLFDSGAQPLLWSRTGAATGSVGGNLDWTLSRLGTPNTVAGDLLRICAGAYLADRLTSRGQAFTRTIELTVHVTEADAWTEDAVEQIADLLWWLTGDDWTIRLVPAGPVEPAVSRIQPAVSEVVLLSGGLDSLCGAVDRLNDGASRLFLSHADGTTAVQHAQREIRTWLTEHATAPPEFLAVTFAQTGAKAESSSRSRSLLFAALSTATATAHGANRVVVPENGYTSINPPLTTSRGGALSTRSTHPTTFARINRLLATLDISVTVENPYQDLTKGELVARAAAKVDTAEFIQAIATSLSCGKLDGTYYKGGNPNYSCGLCVPCVVRRSSVAAASLEDRTPYLVNTLPEASLHRLISNRSDDVLAVQEAVRSGISDDELLACGPWPDDFDLDAAVALCARPSGDCPCRPTLTCPASTATRTSLPTSPLSSGAEFLCRGAHHQSSGHRQSGDGHSVRLIPAAHPSDGC